MNMANEKYDSQAILMTVSHLRELRHSHPKVSSFISNQFASTKVSYLVESATCMKEDALGIVIKSSFILVHKIITHVAVSVANELEPPSLFRQIAVLVVNFLHVLRRFPSHFCLVLHLLRVCGEIFRVAASY
jgi:hypothetical protein